MNQDQIQAAIQNMLQQHLQRRGIACERTLAAMSKIPREKFVAVDDQPWAYADKALTIDCGQTISQPYIVALMTEALKLTGQEHVLEIGTGSGYQTAVLCELAKQVVSIERHEHLSQQAEEKIAELGYKNIKFIIGDGSIGYPAEAPYDRIIVTAAAPITPPILFDQLAENGIMVIPLGGQKEQELYAIKKSRGKEEKTPLSGCRFVPLIGQSAWPEG